MTVLVKEPIQYFGAMDIDGYARSVAEDATERAVAALRRRRPDLRDKGNHEGMPPDEAAQFELDKLAFVAAVTERLITEMNGLVYEARQHGASWARVGAALNESPQTAFNRYRKLEQGRASKDARPAKAESRSKKSAGRGS
jgi:hypothetical protein